MEEKKAYSSGAISIPDYLMEEGTFDVTLVAKMWGKNVNLICVFRKEDGTEFSVVAWRRKLNDRFPEHYAPKKTDIDFADVACHTKWRCAFAFCKTGKYVNWLTAELIE